MEFLNELLSFLFINSKANSLIKGKNKKFELIAAQDIYTREIRSLLGFGFVLSFIPGTEPYSARMNLLSHIIRFESNHTAIHNILNYLFLSQVKSIYKSLFETDNLFKLIRKNKKWNRVNPFLYLTKLFIYFIFIIIGLVIGLASFVSVLLELHNNKKLDLFLMIIFLPIFYIFMFALSWPVLAYMVLYYITELSLNFLYTLLVEPFIFAYEVIKQLYDNWSTQSLLIPTEDFLKLTDLSVAVELQTIEANAKYLEVEIDNLQEQISSLKEILPTSELTLIEGSKDLITNYKKYQNSVFFKVDKKSLPQKSMGTIARFVNPKTRSGQLALSQRRPKKERDSIVDHHNQVENMHAFHLYARYVFPAELNEIIYSFCLKSPTLGFLIPRLRNLTHKAINEEVAQDDSLIASNQATL
ncbi:MAG: hypothetical protein H0U70_08850 [Tatlockia sp.]|nr:hypothetical protein [Tatlockia sp.]